DDKIAWYENTGPSIACGDGVVEGAEVCDDGFTDDCGTCNADCTRPGTGSTCGDGELCPEFEECDDGGESATCDADCTFVECGDGTLNVTAGEHCEPPGSDCCDDSCHFEPAGTPCADDGDVCNGVEACDGSGNCVSQLVADCNENEVEDSCDIEDGTSQDCNGNDIPDECDIADGTSADDNGNGIPDECETAAHLDIKPGSCPNRLNPRSWLVLRMAIVGSESFDVTGIDVDSLTLARADGIGEAIAPLSGPPGPGITVDDVATPFAGEPCDCHDLAGDGIDDLLLKFFTPEMAEALELRSVPHETSLLVTISGSLQDGLAFEASDCLLIRHKLLYLKRVRERRSK
ncbi:MAG: hypothetical protein WBE26_09950, partial [Phycisphaerae bacterium]